MHIFPSTSKIGNKGENPTPDETSLSPPPPPPVHTLVGLNYNLTTPVFNFKQSSARRQRSYEVRHVNLREKRGKERYMKLQQNYKKLQLDYKQLLKKSMQQEAEIKRLRVQLAKSKVVVAKKIVQNKRNLKRLANTRSTVKNKVRYVSKATNDHLHLVQQNLATEKAKGKRLSEDLHLVEEEYCQLEERYQDAQAQVQEFIEGTKQCIPDTMEGHKFTNEIRALYFRLLAENMSPAKIERNIKIVLETFCPQINTKLLKLPKKSLAREIRSSEMPTLAKAHEAAALSQIHSYHVNSDGTTLNQKKVQGYLVNGVTIGVTEVADGTSLTAVDELDRLLASIREVGQELGISHVDKIGWSLIQSLMSDQASTQKTFNSLVKERAERERHEKNADPVTPTDSKEGKEVLETFCGMHLGVNMRTAEVSVLQLYAIPPISISRLLILHVMKKQQAQIASN